ncbi:MAG: hypothetical protein ACRBBN_16475 [Methyloligellaceae bacterium]
MACTTDFFEDDLFSQNVLTDPLDEFLKTFMERIKLTDTISHDEREVSLVTRAPDSHVAQIVLLRANELRDLGIRVKAVFTQLTPSECVERWVDRICECDSISVKNNVRWAKNPQLLNAHEQLVLGKTMCWSGDTMNRKRENRNVAEIFEPDAPGAANIARRAFGALWENASSVSKSQLKRLSIVYTGQQFEPQGQDHVLENWASNFHHVISTRH